MKPVELSPLSFPLMGVTFQLTSPEAEEVAATPVASTMQCNAIHSGCALCIVHCIALHCSVKAGSSLVGDDGWLLSMRNALPASCVQFLLSISRADGSMEVSNYYHLPPAHLPYLLQKSSTCPPTIPATDISRGLKLLQLPSAQVVCHLLLIVCKSNIAA